VDQLLFCLNATIPIFLVMAAGYGLRRANILNDNFVKVSNRLNFNITLPVLLFCDIARMPLSEIFNPAFVLFCMGVTLVSICAVWGLAAWRMKDKRQVGAFVQGSFRGSSAILGVALMQNIYGEAGIAPMMIIGSVPLYNVFSVLILSFGAEKSGLSRGQQIRQALLGILKNPIIWGIVLGLPFAYFRIHLPVIVDKTLSSVASIATPLALMGIGAGFDLKGALGKLKPTLAASAIKLLILPGVFLPVAYALGFRGQEMVALLVMLGGPTTVSSYIMAESMGNDGELASDIVVVTTLVSAVTLTGFLYLLRSLALV
jgi:predicted permease